MNRTKQLILIGVLTLSASVLWLLQRPNEDPTHNIKVSPESSGTTYYASYEKDSSHNVNSKKNEKKALNTRSDTFSSTIQDAYDNEEAVIKARTFVLGFYNIKQDTPIDENFFNSYAEDKVAQAMKDQYKELSDSKIIRQEKLTTYKILSTDPLKISFSISGERNGEKENVTYEVIYDEAVEKIISFVQVNQ